MHKRSATTRRVGVTLWVMLPVAVIVGFLLVMSRSYGLYVVHTGSMEPTIPSKSAVLVHKGDYKVGQVVAFREGGDVVTHRLVAIHGNALTTKGDGNKTDDPWTLSPSDIIGGAVLAPREAGYWLIYLKNPVGLASVLLSIVCVGLIWSIASSYEERSAQGSRSLSEPRHALPRPVVAAQSPA
jgi:signal peptidase